MAERNWTSYRLSKETGLSERHLEDLVAGRVKRPRSETIDRLAEGFGMTSQELLGLENFSTEVALPLTEREQDVLYAAGAFDRAPLREMLRRAIESFISESESDPDVHQILDAMGAGRERRASISTNAGNGEDTQ